MSTSFLSFEMSYDPSPRKFSYGFFDTSFWSLIFNLIYVKLFEISF